MDAFHRNTSFPSVVVYLPARNIRYGEIFPTFPETSIIGIVRAPGRRFDFRDQSVKSSFLSGGIAALPAHLTL
jgi:hypothetical protein